MALGLGNARNARKWLTQASMLRREAPIYTDLAAAIAATGDLAAAERSCRDAIALDARYAPAHVVLGTLLQGMERFADAVRCLRTAIELRPDLLRARVALARNLILTAHYAEAEAELALVLAKDPSHPDAHLLTGTARYEQGDFSAAVGHYQRALASRPEAPHILGCLANAHRDSGDFGKATEIYEEALRLAPDDANVRNDYAHALLLQGDYERGWAFYGARWSANRWAADSEGYAAAPWTGEALAGKRVVIWNEQGLGDQIMFTSILPEILAEAGSCDLVCDPRLQALFARSFPSARVIAAGSDAHAALRREARDFHLPMAELARHRRRRAEDFPRHDGYLRADPQRILAWRARLGALGVGMKIGISWRGGTPTTRGYLRSTRLAEWLPVLQVQGAVFVSLQYGSADDEMERLRKEHGVTLHGIAARPDDYDDTAALVSALDLVVSVTTSLVHLAGAMGRPARVLVPVAPEWRYQSEGDRMLWYPSLKLIRQETADNWTQALRNVAAELSSTQAV